MNNAECPPLYKVPSNILKHCLSSMYSPARRALVNDVGNPNAKVLSPDPGYITYRKNKYKDVLQHWNLLTLI